MSGRNELQSALNITLRRFADSSKHALDQVSAIVREAFCPVIAAPSCP
jgi:hypothetical protein